MPAFRLQVQEEEDMSSAATQTEAKPGEDKPHEASPGSRPGTEAANRAGHSRTFSLGAGSWPLPLEKHLSGSRPD